MSRRKDSCIPQLLNLGISWDDAHALRRISMTLHRWHELECGNGNDYGSWTVTRGHKVGKIFEHDEDGATFLEHHHYLHGRGKDYVSYTRIPDREKGAKKRLAAILARYPNLSSYVQGDPRGAALYILRPQDVPQGESPCAYYSRGICVYK